MPSTRKPNRPGRACPAKREQGTWPRRPGIARFGIHRGRPGKPDWGTRIFALLDRSQIISFATRRGCLFLPPPDARRDSLSIANTGKNGSSFKVVEEK